MDWFSTIIGALIGFVSSIGIIITERLLDKKGKLKIYYVMVHGDESTDCFGFYHSSDGMAFIAPMKLEIQNTSNVTRVIRDVSLLMYNNGRCVETMTQITTAGNTKIKNGEIVGKKAHEYGGDKNSYSFVIPPRSIQRQYCNYAFSNNKSINAPIEFDEIRLRYFDEKDKPRIFSVREIANCWKPMRLSGDDKWILLN